MPDFAGWRHAFDAALVERRAQLAAILEHILGEPASSPPEARSAARALAQLTAPNHSASVMLCGHAQRIRQQQAALLRQHSSGGQQGWGGAEVGRGGSRGAPCRRRCRYPHPAAGARLQRPPRPCSPSSSPPASPPPPSRRRRPGRPGLRRRAGAAHLPGHSARSGRPGRGGCQRQCQCVWVEGGGGRVWRGRATPRLCTGVGWGVGWGGGWPSSAALPSPPHHPTPGSRQPAAGSGGTRVATAAP
jgi:hypothetical protein